MKKQNVNGDAQRAAGRDRRCGSFAGILILATLAAGVGSFGTGGSSDAAEPAARTRLREICREIEWEYYRLGESGREAEWPDLARGWRVDLVRMKKLQALSAAANALETAIEETGRRLRGDVERPFAIDEAWAGARAALER